uniref:Uncharacterized protein n=1 Tax=Rhizobium meliloti TaxID=382 RepID=I2E1S0_RHIML|nr:short hypothetical protein [Sinorhizobium meliloti]
MGVGEQLKHARKAIIGAPAAMQRRQSVFLFFTVDWDRSR